MTAATIAKGLSKCRKSGTGYTACCPAHPDNDPSLSITERDGKPLVRCHAGCPQDAVVAALKELNLWPEREQSAKPQIIAEYTYTDTDGNTLYQVCRVSPKGFFQRVPDGAGGWLKRGPKEKDKVLYRLREVLEAPIVFVVEGERDAETLRDYGFMGTTNAGGANAPWLPQFTEALRGREVILIPDNDAPGRQRVLRIARALKGNVARLIILTLDDPRAKDISDWFLVGHSEAELISMLDGERVSK